MKLLVSLALVLWLGGCASDGGKTAGKSFDDKTPSRRNAAGSCPTTLGEMGANN